MHPARLPAFFAALSLALAALAGASLADDARVTGTATYLDRALLPPGAVLEVYLEDVSRAGAPAEVIATDRQEALGAPPYPFALAYDPARIDPRFTYAVRARVTLGDRLLMTTDTHVPVITGGAPKEVEVILRRVPAQPEQADRTFTAPGLTLPASFTGTTPMAGGSGRAWHLDLWPDQVFHLLQSDGDDGTTSDIGRWSADPARGAIVLRGGREAPAFLEILGNGDLRPMDQHGNRIDSDLPHTLTAGPLVPAEVALFMTGMFRYMADAPVFTECLTGRSHPVAMEGDYLAAERAYTALDGREPGAPILAVLEGRLAMRPAMEGPDRTQLVIDRFARFEPGQACGDADAGGSLHPDAALTDTYWRIRDIAGEAVRPAPNRREPHLILRTGETPDFAATIGCNMMRGRYEADNGSLTFGPAAMTRMGCPPPLAAMEEALAQALPLVARWHIDGGTLDLFDAGGDRLLQAEAVYLP